MLLGFGILQIRPWVCFTCSHPEKSMTSLTSRLRQPVLQKALPWPHSSSWQQHSRSGQGWLCPLVGLGEGHAFPRAGASPGVMWVGDLSSPQPGPVCSIYIHETGGLVGHASHTGMGLVTVPNTLGVGG